MWYYDYTLGMNKGYSRTAEARKYIENHWYRMSDRELGEALDMSMQSVRAMRARMGLIRHPDNTAAMHRDSMNKRHQITVMRGGEKLNKPKKTEEELEEEMRKKMFG